VKRGVFFVAIAAVAWGSGGVVASVLYRTSGLGPIAVSFWRLLIGVAILAAVRGPRAGNARPGGAGRAGGRPRDWRMLVLSGVGLAIYQTAYYGAVAEAGVAVGTVVTLGTGPVLIALGGRYALGERLGAGATVAVGTAIGGLVLLVAGGLEESSARRPGLGIGLALLSAAGYAAVTLLMRARRGIEDPRDTALAGFAIGAACLLPLALIEGLLPDLTDPTSPADPAALAGTVAWLLYLGAVPTALAYALFFAGLSGIRAATASVVALLEVVTAAVAAVALLGERLTGAAVAGSAVLFAAVVALARDEARSVAS
jgi:DME family drug/metabolite transporter